MKDTEAQVQDDWGGTDLAWRVRKQGQLGKDEQGRLQQTQRRRSKRQAQRTAQAEVSSQCAVKEKYF